MIGNGNSTHAIIIRFINQRINRGLSVEQRILGMNMQMYKGFHAVICVLIRQRKITVYFIADNYTSD